MDAKTYARLVSDTASPIEWRRAVANYAANLTNGVITFGDGEFAETPVDALNSADSDLEQFVCSKVAEMDR
jgi:hypothetical protein